MRVYTVYAHTYTHVCTHIYSHTHTFSLTYTMPYIHAQTVCVYCTTVFISP